MLCLKSQCNQYYNPLIGDLLLQSSAALLGFCVQMNYAVSEHILSAVSTTFRTFYFSDVSHPWVLNCFNCTNDMWNFSSSNNGVVGSSLAWYGKDENIISPEYFYMQIMIAWCSIYDRVLSSRWFMVQYLHRMQQMTSSLSHTH